MEDEKRDELIGLVESWKWERRKRKCPNCGESAWYKFKVKIINVDIPVLLDGLEVASQMLKRYYITKVNEKSK